MNGDGSDLLRLAGVEAIGFISNSKWAGLGTILVEGRIGSIMGLVVLMMAPVGVKMECRLRIEWVVGRTEGGSCASRELVGGSTWLTESPMAESSVVVVVEVAVTA